MAGSRVIRLDDLRRACSDILDAAEERFGPEIAIAEPYYWTVDLRSAYQLVENAAEALEVGSLGDDAEEVSPADRDELLLWHRGDHLAGLIRYVAFLDLPSGAR